MSGTQSDTVGHGWTGVDTTSLDDFRRRLGADLDQRRLRKQRQAAIRAALASARRKGKQRHHRERLQALADHEGDRPVTYRGSRGTRRGRGAAPDPERPAAAKSAPLPPCCADAPGDECPQHAAIRLQREREAKRQANRNPNRAQL